jgi:putative SOS response-associated peptidase YedK
VPLGRSSDIDGRCEVGALADRTSGSRCLISGISFDHVCNKAQRPSSTSLKRRDVKGGHSLGGGVENRAGWFSLGKYPGHVCGRATSTTPRDTLARLLDVDEVDTPELPISWNVAPTQPLYVVATSSNGTRKLRSLRWGLVPSWATDPSTGSKLINARAETLAKRPAYRALISTRRALVTVSGFYEWRRSGPGSRALRQPCYFHRADGEPMVFAGLWDLWLDGEGRPLRTCTIITTAANKATAPVHDRMPAILLPEVWEEWLRPGTLDARRLARLLAPAPDDLLDIYPVGTAVNDARSNGPELIMPASECPPLFSLLLKDNEGHTS